MQLFVYGGAVTILVLFVLMLSGEAGRDRGESSRRSVAWIGARRVRRVLRAARAHHRLGTTWPLAAGPRRSTPRRIATILFSRYVLPFEIAGLALTVALIGAIVLSREDDDSATPPADEGGGEA